MQFESREGISLAGSLALPVGSNPSAYALFAHCFTCHKDLKAVLHITQALTQQGIAVFRFDFTGLGQSGGDFMDTNFSSNVEDLIVAAKFLKESYQAPQIIIGHSLGGAAVLLAATRLDDVKAIVTLGAPAEPLHVQNHFQESIAKINKEGKATVSIGGRPFTIKKQFIDDLAQVDLAAELKNLKKALLIMHSPQDTIVSIEHAAKIYKLATHPKSFISLEGADHLLTKKVDSMYVGSIIAIWASRYIVHETS